MPLISPYFPCSPPFSASQDSRHFATTVPNLVSWQLAFSEGLWWQRWRRRWRRRAGLELGFRGGAAPWEWRISALHEDRMFLKCEVHKKIEPFMFITFVWGRFPCQSDHVGGNSMCVEKSTKAVESHVNFGKWACQTPVKCVSVLHTAKTHSHRFITPQVGKASVVIYSVWCEM